MSWIRESRVWVMVAFQDVVGSNGLSRMVPLFENVGVSLEGVNSTMEESPGWSVRTTAMPLALMNRARVV